MSSLSAMALLGQKLRMFIAKIAEPNYVLDTYYAEGLINKFSCKSDPDVEQLVKSEIPSDIIIAASKNLDTYHITVKVFLTRFMAILCHNEVTFGQIIATKGDYLANSFKLINTKEMTVSLKVAYMELALAILGHSSGLKWLLQTETWTHILVIPNEGQSVFFIRQKYSFASQFLWRLEYIKDEENIVNVLSQLLKPLMTTDFISVNSMTSEEEEQLAKVLEPMAHMMIAVFNGNADKYRQKTIIVSVVLNKFTLVSRLFSIHELLHKEELLVLMFKLAFWLLSAKIFLMKPLTDNTVYESQDLLEISATYFNMVQTFMKLRNITAILDFTNACNFIWSQIWQGKGPLVENFDGTKVEFQSQLIVLLIVPLMQYIKWNNGNCKDNFLTEYVSKLFDSNFEHTARAGYGMRDLSKELDQTSVIIASVKRIPFLKNHISNEQANLIFRGLFFVLRDFASEDEFVDNYTNYEARAEKVGILTSVMDTILLFLKSFNINWQESIEVLCLYTVVSGILMKKSHLTPKFIVSALSVLSVSVKQFQPPNLSLLMKASGTTAISDIGNLIYRRLHDMHWEVRDSALEMLLVITELSFVKFPPFQEQIIENELVVVAATIAQNDSEPYVRASALRVIGAASIVHALWDNLIKARPDIQDTLISTLRNNEEGIVRKEAASALCEVYRNVKLTQSFTLLLYQHMVSSALTDFHWEVQIAALKFIKGVISQTLSEQGMLDGTFPAVTFSKEKRKIVTLNEKEVQRRLIKSLDDLSAIGCLTVLVLLLHGDTELEIMEQALTISEDLLKILNEYKVPEVLGTTDEEIEDLSQIVCKIKEDTETLSDAMEEDGSKSERVIDGILNSSDINLLANIFENQLNYNESIVEPKLKLQKLVTPSMFVMFLFTKDFRSIIEQKRKWSAGIRSLGSLIDDALGIYEIYEGVNTMDCY